MKIVCLLASIALCSCGGTTPSSQGHERDAGSSSDGPAAHDAANDAHSKADAADLTDGGAAILPSLNASCNGDSSLTGQAVLDALLPEYSATYTPIGSGSPTALTIRTHYDKGPAACEPRGCEMCPPGWVQVEVQMDFVTADGLFNESFTTPVELSSGSTTLNWDPVVSEADIKGTYRPTLVGHPTVDLSFGGSFSGATTSGLVEQQAMNGNMGSVAGAGTWQ